MNRSNSFSPGSVGIKIGLAIIFVIALKANAIVRPLANSPVGQFSGTVALEYDRRTITNDLVAVRRPSLRFGYTPREHLTLWVEGGMASLELFINNRRPQGDYGTAIGGGWVWSIPKYSRWGWTPFASGRATYFHSRLSDDVRQGVSTTSRRSRFEWSETSLICGGAKQYEPGLLFGGLAFRMLTQDEKRSQRTGTSVVNSNFTYSSGLRPGMMLGWQRSFNHRITIATTMEVFPEGGRLTATFSQWGSP